MNCITLTQPWATLVAIGVKTIETRSWAPARKVIGEPLAIHAAKGFPGSFRDLCSEEPFYEELIKAGIKSWKDLPRGVVLATSRLDSVFQMGRITSACTSDLYRMLKRQMYPDCAFGDFARGRYAWVLDDVVPLKVPRAAKGALGIWQWEP